MNLAHLVLPLRSLSAKVRRRIRARARVAADNQGTPYCLSCQFPNQCGARGACARTGLALTQEDSNG
jgi:hypothetical protein